MGKAGRLVKEKEWTFQADWCSMAFATTGEGFILERGNECTGTLSQDPRTIEVKSGYVIADTNNKRYFPGNTVQLDENTEKYPRLDLLALVPDNDDPGKMELLVLKGTPAESPKVPQLPNPSREELIIPIAIIGFQKYSKQIHSIMDVRSVLDSEHDHGAGDALDLSRDRAEMSLRADGVKINVGTNGLQVVDETLTIEDFGITWGDGLEKKDTGGFRVDKGHGLRFDHTETVAVENEELWFDAAAAAGDGLVEDGSSGQLKADVDKGVTIGDMGLEIDTGEGLFLNLLNAGKLEADLVSDGGLETDTDGKIYVDPNDFANGNGLGVSSGDMVITPGTGLKIDPSLRTDETDGLRVWNQQLEINPGYGVEFDSNNLVQLDNADLVTDVDGTGLTTNTDVLEIGAYSGVAISSGKLTIDDGEGVSVGSSGVGLKTDNDTIEISNGSLKVMPGGIDGLGLTSTTDLVETSIGQGMGSSSGSLKISGGFGVDAPSGSPVKINRSDIFGSSITTYTDGDGVTRGKTDFFPHAFEKIDYSESEVIDASAKTNYVHATVGDSYSGDDIWIFTTPVSGQYDGYRNEMEVFYEQGETGGSWWSTIRLENPGDQNGNEQGEIWIKYLALTPKWTT